MRHRRGVLPFLSCSLSMILQFDMSRTSRDLGSFPFSWERLSSQNLLPDKLSLLMLYLLRLGRFLMLCFERSQVSITVPFGRALSCSRLFTRITVSFLQVSTLVEPCLSLRAENPLQIGSVKQHAHRHTRVTIYFVFIVLINF